MADYEEKHLNCVRQIAPECMVLLKADGSFPLKQAGRIALYGSGARRTLKGGRGSADVNVKSYPTVEQGLIHAGFTVTTAYWLEAYERAWKKARVGFRNWLKEKIAREGMDLLMENLSIVMPEPEYEIPLTGEGDTAIYVLSRLCGEGVDRQDVPGDFRLSKTEIRDILQLEEQYEKFLLVLNVGCIVDLSPVAERVSNILLLSQTGSTIGDSLADVVLGRAYPSGKLAATWAAGEDYCTVGEFGDRNDVRYREGIYVGYRYFDSVGKTPIFPFGYGLGYTTFSLTPGTLGHRGTVLTLPVTVKNTGRHPGKEVVQLYVSVPEGRLDQPWQTLAAFEKTRELAPGEEEEVVLSFSMESLASTDCSRNGRLLEPGNYILRVGNSSRNTRIAGRVELLEEVITEEITPVGGETDFTDWRPEKCEREQAVRCLEALAGKEQELHSPGASAPSAEAVSTVTLGAYDFIPAVHERPEPDPKALSLVKLLPEEELAYLCTGDFIGEGSRNVIGDSALTVIGAAGETTGRFRKQGIPNLVMADGPSGLRLPLEYGVDEQGAFPIEAKGDGLTEQEDKLELLPEEMLKPLLAMLPSVQQEERKGQIYEQSCTAIPIATAFAQSWNRKAVRECAELVAEEMEHFGIHIWLAPALNIQRHPLCGRTFEYYSEDPLLSGQMAAAVTQGIQSRPGRCVTIKHFLCNNQEANRFRSNSLVNERTLRDIYARGFEIVVKEAHPMALMTSYNLLNGLHTCESRGLLEGMLRGEWGYDGIIMSDFLTGDKAKADERNKYPKFRSAPSIKAGLDLLMPGGKAHYENILNALREDTQQDSLSRRELEECAARMAAFAWKLYPAQASAAASSTDTRKNQEIGG